MSEISIPKVQAHKTYSQKTFFEFYGHAQLCLIFMSMSKTGCLLDCTTVSARKDPFKPGRNLLITQSKPFIFRSNEKFLNLIENYS